MTGCLLHVAFNFCTMLLSFFCYHLNVHFMLMYLLIMRYNRHSWNNSNLLLVLIKALSNMSRRWPCYTTPNVYLVCLASNFCLICFCIMNCNVISCLDYYIQPFLVVSDMENRVQSSNVFNPDRIISNEFFTNNSHILILLYHLFKTKV